MNPLVQFIKTHPNAQLPTYSHALDVGADICIIHDIHLINGITLIVDTGLQLAFCDPNFEIQIRPRSGLAAKYGITITNSPGTIDPGYRGPIRLILSKLDSESCSTTRFFAGDRLAQLVIAPRYRANFEFTEKEVPADDNRGSGGYGSTGV